MADLLRKIFYFGLFSLVVGGLWFIADLSASTDDSLAQVFHRRPLPVPEVSPVASARK